jgi:hypothetical protein
MSYNLALCAFVFVHVCVRYRIVYGLLRCGAPAGLMSACGLPLGEGQAAGAPRLSSSGTVGVTLVKT